MSTALSVLADEAARRSGDIPAVIASLPESLRPDGTGTELVAIDGASGWVTAALAAIDGGAKGLVVINPVVEDAAAVMNAAQQKRVAVVIDRPFAGNPAVPGVREHFATMGGPHALLECTLTTPLGADLTRVLMDQLALVGALAHPLSTARALDRTARRHAIAGLTADGRRVRLTCVCTNARPPTALVRQLGENGSVSLTLPNPDTARPGHATVTTADGAKLLPTLFETAHRVAWRRLVRLVHAGGQPDDMALFAHDSSIAGALMGR